MEKLVNELNQTFKNADTELILKYLVESEVTKSVLSSSFGVEDQVLTHMMLNIDKKANIFTLDTGRLPYETYSVMDETNLKYGIKVEVYFPKNENVEKLYQEQGINGFYESIENRKRCCSLRKIEPLKRALQKYDFWITGLRSSQSITRENMNLFEFDQGNNVIKVNPLIDWSEKQVWDFIKKNNIPYNKLHKQGYPSIGCAPCTRPVKDGEDIRSGRWWWENPEHKECGLHAK